MNEAEKQFSFKLKDYIHASREQDIFEHWDMKGILFDVTDKSFKFDVKGIKRDTRHGNLNTKIVWTESKNVRGNPGWLYGKADYIAFEKTDEFVVVDRVILLNFMRNKIEDNDNELVSNPHDALYKIYQRNGRKDKISKALMSDMESISEWIVNKDA
jgi:hypothetical protein|tara:strand:+ start:78 stop:548 length:471 start_codon:yes stop_codon:yes gene_type:complete